VAEARQQHQPKGSNTRGLPPSSQAFKTDWIIYLKWTTGNDHPENTQQRDQWCLSMTELCVTHILGTLLWALCCDAQNAPAAQSG
jgi:hypothetical protein